MPEYPFGWIPSDPDARDHLMAAAFPGIEQAPPQDNHWPCRIVLNQIPYPECVGFSWATWGDCAPVEQKWGNPMGRLIYREAKKLDGKPNEVGTTIRAGAKVMLNRNRIARYFWASSVDEALRYVGAHGPCLFGTMWTSGMCKPSLLSNTIRATGKVIGGHAYVVCGVEWKRNRARIHQTWGAEWGDNGECWIPIPDLRLVFKARGEACAATERPMNGGTG